MRRASWPTESDRSAGCRRSVIWLVAALATAGCGGDPKITFSSVSDPPTVRLIQPPVRTIVRVVGQPSFVDTYEQTSIYPKMTAYIEKWIVDIGDKVKKGDVLATLFVPETVEDFKTKKADVEVAKVLIEQSLKLLDVAEAEVKAAKAHVAAARSSLAKYQAEVDRWDSEVKRLTKEVDKGVVSPQILLESTNQLKSSTASRDAEQSTIAAAVADELAREADAAKAKVDVALARARLTVAESDAKRLEAWVGYLTLTAPYDGVIVARNANTGDFVLPASGDPSATPRSPDQSAARATPIYVVDRTDLLRIYVDVPEEDADFVHIGTKAKVLARAFRDKELPASVTRTSWALNVKSRTLRAEIDIPNPDSRILPGMYAYGKVIIERPGVRALPLDALVYSGNGTFCWRYENGHAERIELETGVSDGDWIEVTNRRVPTSLAETNDAPWTPIDGSEQVVLGDLSVLTDGAPVKVATAPGGTKVARATPP
ncbi:MAG TPA: efflux RND transporter periplasmic adaptor subunit [Isosphaeraceae bacterium]|jgi:RND family efflux transporter MFP subunit|nr:efflux RND transporter periplasmic adaptor subunit [Isosphaeraceae bacterium]